MEKIQPSRKSSGINSREEYVREYLSFKTSDKTSVDEYQNAPLHTPNGT